MFCMNCGKELPDDANFCLKCGQLQRADVQTAQSTPEQWETCEIVYEIVTKSALFRRQKIRFWAKALGPKGPYSAGESTVFDAYHLAHPADSDSLRDIYGRNLKEQRPILDALIAKLIQDGWITAQYPAASDPWYSYRLRRRVM